MDINKHREIESYLRGELSNEEVIAFEQKMDANHTLKEEVLIQQSLHDVFSKNVNNSKSQSLNIEQIKNLSRKLKNEEHQKIYNSIKTNTSNYLEKRRKKGSFSKKYKSIISIAAISIFILTTTIFFNTNSSTSTESYYNSYADWNNIPSFKEKGIQNKDLIKIEKQYISSNHKEVINTINSLSEDTISNQPYLLIYLGHSYFHQNNYEKSLEVFEKFSQSNSYDSSKGHWYKLLIYLKQDNIEQAKKELDIITKKSSNYNYKIARQILKEMN